MKLKVLFWALASVIVAFFTLSAYVMSAGLPGKFYVLEAVLVILCLFLFWFYRKVVKPLQSIGNGMELLREQDFSSRLTPVGQKEADRIVAIFNRMMDQLKNERLRSKEQDHFLKLLIEASPMGVVILSQDGKVASSNLAAIRFLGIAPEIGIEGKKLSELNSVLGEELLKMSQGEISTFRMSDSNLYRCSCLSFVDSGYRHPFLLIESLTEEVRKAEKKAYGKVIRMIAHEVNNTTAGVTSTLDSVGQALENIEKTDDLREIMQVCVERCYGMSRFITNFADLVRIPVPQLRPCRLNELVRSCTCLMETLCRQNEIDVRLNLAPADPVIDLDAVLFEQVVVNILGNAAESIGKSGDIYVSTSSAPVCLEITDNGKGIDKETETKLFTPFFSTKPHGQGIGLMLIREILVRHRCEFSLKTGTDGLTRFKICFA